MRKASKVSLLFWIGISLFSTAGLLADDGMNDQKATIFDVSGNVRILKKGQSAWINADKEMVLEAGDQILTGKDSHLEIVYDALFYNVARIDENTKAEFRSIEPTDLHLEDGTIFNALDGLQKEDSYQVSTPTAVGAVRGTHFDAIYNAQTEIASFATLPVPDDNHLSAILVTDILDNGQMGNSIEIPEGSQIDIHPGDILQPEQIIAVEPERVERAEQALNEMEPGDLPQDPPAEDSDKAVFDGNPPDNGDDLGPERGSEQDPMGNGLAAKVDAMIDKLIPLDDVPLAGTEIEEGISDEATGSENQQQNDETNNTSGGPNGARTPTKTRGLAFPGAAMNLSEQKPGEKGPKSEPVFVDAITEFFAVGMENQQPGIEPGNMADQAAEIMKGFGFTPEFAQDFSETMTRFMDLGGGLNNFMGREALAATGDGPAIPKDFNARMQMMQDFAQHMDTSGSGMNMDPADFQNLFQLDQTLEDLARITVEQQLKDTVVTTEVRRVLSNPWLARVHAILSADLSAVERANLLALAQGSTLTRGGAVLGDVDQNGVTDKIINVVYTNVDGVHVNGQYTEIQNNDNSIFQPPTQEGIPYLVPDVQ